MGDDGDDGPDGDDGGSDDVDTGEMSAPTSFATAAPPAESTGGDAAASPAAEHPSQPEPPATDTDEP